MLELFLYQVLFDWSLHILFNRLYTNEPSANNLSLVAFHASLSPAVITASGEAGFSGLSSYTNFISASISCPGFITPESDA